MKLFGIIKILLGYPPCSHPFGKSKPVFKYIVPNSEHSEGGYEFHHAVNIRSCGRCGHHFIDEGMEYK